MPTDEKQAASYGESLVPELTRLLEVAADLNECLTGEVRDELNMLKEIANSYKEALDLLEAWADGGRPLEATREFFRRERGD